MNILKRIKLLKSIITGMLFPLIIVLFVLVLQISILGGLEGSKFIDRTDLLLKIEKVISKGASLDDVKQIYQNRKHIRRNIFSFGKGKSAQYVEPISLSTVLKDLKSELYLRENVDKNLANSIKKILDNHEKTNPFDKLESGQKLYFEVIQSKLGDNYSLIQENINRIVDQLVNKNQLVTEYFKDATFSFRLSVFALVLGALAFIPQVFAAWRWWRRRSEQEAKD